MTFCNNLGLCLNLLYFAILWSVGFFGYYLLNFQLKYLPGNIHANNVASGLSELISIILPLYLDRLGIKISMILALLLTVIGGLFIMISG